MESRAAATIQTYWRHHRQERKSLALATTRWFEHIEPNFQMPRPGTVRDSAACAKQNYLLVKQRILDLQAQCERSQSRHAMQQQKWEEAQTQHLNTMDELRAACEAKVSSNRLELTGKLEGQVALLESLVQDKQKAMETINSQKTTIL